MLLQCPLQTVRNQSVEKMKKTVSIIGGGAAGCFCAVQLKRQCPDLRVVVYERSTRLMAKLAVTGGGRCNLTNSFAHFVDERGRYSDLQLAYPRGDKLLRRLFGVFSHTDTMRWFEQQGVRLVTQEDECVFPASQDAMQIVNLLGRMMQQGGVEVHCGHRLTDVKRCAGSGYQLFFEGKDESVPTDLVVVTTGGGEASFLKSLSVEIVPPLPSLFTFNLAVASESFHTPESDSPMCQRLMGTVVEDVAVSLAGTKHRAHGALLWTHWGVSGPAILRLSSYAARTLADRNYVGELMVNWCGGLHEDEVRSNLQRMMKEHGQRAVANEYPSFLTQKHWMLMLQQCGIPLTQRWNALNATHLRRLVAILTAQPLRIAGRCKYKEEFVTCGGVSLSCVNPRTLEHREYAGLYFAGEALDVDAVTGGFNLQAAWTTAYCVAQAVVKT